MSLFGYILHTKLGGAFLKQSVMVVDDNLELLSIIERILAPYYRVSLFSDGQKALDYLRDGGQPHLLLSDLRMPGLNGFMVLSEAKRLCPGLKTMLVSGYVTGCKEEVKIVTQFACEVLCKPFRRSELVDKIRSLIGC